MTRIVSIIEDNELYMQALVNVISNSEGFLLGQVYSSAEAAIDMLRNPPDIAIVDINLPGKSGIELIVQLQAANIHTQCLVCSMHDDDDHIVHALESGAVAAQTIIEFRDELENESSFTELADRYRSNYSRTFNARLRVSAWLRRAAFVPRLAETAIVCFGFSDAIRRRVARATRRSSDLSTTTIPQITHDVKLKQV